MTDRPARNRRFREVRATTLSAQRVPQSEIDKLRALQTKRQLPMTRGECAGGERPCCYVSCRHNLFLDVNLVSGSVKLNFPDVEPEDMTESCALDVSEGGGETLEHIARLMNLTRERVRQVEEMALRKMATVAKELREMREP